MRELVARVRAEIEVYRLAVRDPRTPRSARWLLAAATGYLLLPIDLIPDFIPGLGYLDDVVVVGLLLRGAMRRIPAEVLRDCRARAAGGAQVTSKQ